VELNIDFYSGPAGMRASSSGGCRFAHLHIAPAARAGFCLRGPAVGAGRRVMHA